MDSTGVTVEGLAKKVKALERLGVEVTDLKAAFGRIGARAVQYARPMVPVRSGRLADSLRVAKTSNKAVVRAGSAKVPYAGVQNYGWPKKGIKGTGFLTRAADDHTDEYRDAISDEIDALIRKYDLTPTGLDLH